MFTHLNCQSAYSFKYGTALAKDLVTRANQLEMSALALTDRDNLAGAIRFVTACKDAGIAPILGVNIKLAGGRVTLLASSENGWPALCRFMSGVAGQQITHQLLEELSIYTKNLFILHGPDSSVTAAIINRRQPFLEFNKYRRYFRESFIECVSHLNSDGPKSTSGAAQVYNFAIEHELPVVISNAVRMVDKSDGPVADILDATRLLSPLTSRSVERRNSEGYLKSGAAMVALADEVTRGRGAQLIKATQRLAESCILSPERDFGLGTIQLPDTKITIADLRARCEAGLSDRYSTAGQLRAARERLSEELTTVATLGYESYFATVADVVELAKGRGIRVAARGSGAGSIICHLLGISGVDPIRYGLLMERFCSPLRRALPDIDIDVESARRLEIYDLVLKKYGEASATVAMVETYRARNAIRDTGKALGLPQIEIDLLAKSMPHIRARNIAKAIENLPELKKLREKPALAQMVLQMAERLDGLPRHLAMHPCAVVLSNSSLPDRAPMVTNASGYKMVEFDKEDVEAIGLLKLDILGVRMQSAIAHAVSEVERIEVRKLDIEKIPLDDSATFDLIKSTKTIGLFQIESPGQRELVGKLAPETFEDLIIDISLFRPGPVKSDMITPFLNARHGFAAPKLIHPDLHRVLAQSNGVVVFHEQVIEIISIMTGISLAEADEKRRALGDFSQHQIICDWFFEAATKKYELNVVTEIWEVLRAFASFGFCKAHAAAFALPTYQSAWLKTHHPAAFIAGLLTHDPGMYPKRLILDEARQLGLTIEPIDVNKSSAETRVEGSGIRISFSEISGINSEEIRTIVAGQPYLDLADFYRRSGASFPTTEKLILTGGFDQLHKLGQLGQSDQSDKTEASNLNRRDLLLHLAELEKSPVAPLPGGQLTFGFEPPALISSGLPDLKKSERVRHEVAELGMEVSEHLLKPFYQHLSKIGAIRSCDLIKQRSGSKVTVAGVRVALQTPPIRSGKRVIFLTIDDGFGCSDATFFSDVQGEFGEVLFKSQLFLVRGIVRRTGPRGVSIRATGAWELSTSLLT